MLLDGVHLPNITCCYMDITSGVVGEGRGGRLLTSVEGAQRFCTSWCGSKISGSLRCHFLWIFQ